MNDTECFQEALKQWYIRNILSPLGGVMFADMPFLVQREIVTDAQKIKDGQHEAKKTGN